MSEWGWGGRWVGWIKGGLKWRLSEGEWKRKEGLGRCIYIRHEGCTFMLSKTRLFRFHQRSHQWVFGVGREAVITFRIYLLTRHLTPHSPSILNLKTESGFQSILPPLALPPQPLPSLLSSLHSPKPPIPLPPCFQTHPLPTKDFPVGPDLGEELQM